LQFKEKKAIAQIAPNIKNKKKRQKKRAPKGAQNKMSVF